MNVVFQAHSSLFKQPIAVELARANLRGRHPRTEARNAMSIDQAAAYRRASRTLMGSVVPTSAGMASGFAAAAVLGKEITDSETLAGLAAAMMQVGGVAMTVPLARRMARLGRRRGLVAGWSLGVAGSAFAFIAAIANFYPLLIVGLLGTGAGNTTNLAARFASADLAPEDRRARAIGMLVWSTTFGAALGPTIALGPASSAARFLGLPELAGPYLLGIVLFAVGLTITHLWLRPDPLEVLGTIGSKPATNGRESGNIGGDARTTGREPGTIGRAPGNIGRESGTIGKGPGTTGREPGNIGREAPRPASLAVIGRRIATVPAARLAVIAMLTCQAVMVGVMTMTPLHMDNGNHHLRVIGWVISVHVIGMFAFSPIVGWLVDRIGPYVMVGLGGIILFMGAEIAARSSAEDSAGMFVGLLLVGLGWSFGLIAGSALLTAAFPVAQRVEMQGGADLLMTGGGAIAGLSSGAAMEQFGFQSLSHWAGLAALLLVVAAVAAWLTSRRPPHQAKATHPTPT